MTLTPGHAGALSAVLALALGVTGCAQANDNTSETLPGSSASAASVTVNETTQVSAPTIRANSEQEFLDQLARFGLPTGMSSDTTVEVGIGICQNLAEGAETDTILNHIRPLSSAIAAQSDNHDTDEVGRTIVEASRTHLCG